MHTYLLPSHSSTPFISCCSFEEQQAMSRVFGNPPPFRNPLPCLTIRKHVIQGSSHVIDMQCCCISLAQLLNESHYIYVLPLRCSSRTSVCVSRLRVSQCTRRRPSFSSELLQGRQWGIHWRDQVRLVSLVYCSL